MKPFACPLNLGRVRTCRLTLLSPDFPTLKQASGPHPAWHQGPTGAPVRIDLCKVRRRVKAGGGGLAVQGQLGGKQSHVFNVDLGNNLPDAWIRGTLCPHFVTRLREDRPSSPEARCAREGSRPGVRVLAWPWTPEAPRRLLPRLPQRVSPRNFFAKIQIPVLLEGVCLTADDRHGAR